jgi:hypothetical protein
MALRAKACPRGGIASPPLFSLFILCILYYNNMKLVKTIKVKLDVEAAKLLPTIHAYTNSFNYVSHIGFSNKKTHSN